MGSHTSISLGMLLLAYDCRYAHNAFWLDSAYRTFGGFVTGIAIRYEPSVIVDNTHQTLAANLAIGERMPPQIFIRAASVKPVEVQDLLPADTRFKILVFAGNISTDKDRATLHVLAGELDKPGNFLRRYGRGDVFRWDVFDVLCFSSAKRDQVDYLGERP